MTLPKKDIAAPALLFLQEFFQTRSSLQNLHFFLTLADMALLFLSLATSQPGYILSHSRFRSWVGIVGASGRGFWRDLGNRAGSFSLSLAGSFVAFFGNDCGRFNRGCCPFKVVVFFMPSP